MIRGVWGFSELPRWCGKPYEPGSPNTNPGGQLERPAISTSPKLNLQIQPRYSIYVSDEQTGEFIVDAGLSYFHGRPWFNSTPVTSDENATQAFSELYFEVRIESTDQLLVSDNVTVNTTSNIIEFDLGHLVPQLVPYSIVIYGAPSASQANQSYSASTELFYLPSKRNGSMVKVDNLHGGILTANNASRFTFEPLFPFGFYTGCSNYLNYGVANVSAYKDLGLNAINPGCSFASEDMSFLFDWLDNVGLWYQYNMRWSYSNLTSVKEQIPHIKERPNFLSWYTADEPDGNGDPLNATRSSYDLLKREDPYHPISLVLNCENYYFKEYSSGADFIMEDAYPIGIDPIYSRKFDTVCNTTYGDCGCDNCIGELQDVSNRLDTLSKYINWTEGPRKPLWAVLQSFSGEQYWSRDPTPQETWAMMLISVNHGAKGIMSWDFPTSSAQTEAYSEMAKVATVPPVSKILLGSQPQTLVVYDHPLLDVAYWKSGEEIMLSVANLDYQSYENTISIPLPKNITRISNQTWGSVEWSLGGNNTIIAKRLEALATSLVILS